MKPGRLSRARRRPRVVALVLLLVIAGLGAVPTPVGTRLPLGWSAALAADGTPAAGGPIVIVAPERSSLANPIGEQRLRLAGPLQDPPTLDPALAQDVGTAFLCRQLYAGLTRFDASLAPVPDLADRIEISPDGLRYTFRLSPNAAYADGRPISAADVVASLTRTLTPIAGVPVDALAGPAYLSDVEGALDLTAGTSTTLAGARAIDERTLELRLAAPRATFLMKLAVSQLGVVDPRDVARGGEWWRAPNASGPFRVDAWEPDVALNLVANEHYVGGRPPLDRIDVRVGPSANQPYNLYQAGAIDAVDVPPTAIDRALDPGNPDASRVVTTPIFSTAYLAFRDDTPPLDDPHVRRAIALAFPRDRLAAVGFGGHALPASGIIPPGMLGRDWPGSLPPYDLDEARAELAASRYGSAAAVPPIRIYAAAPFGAAALRDVLAKDLGLRIEVIEVEWRAFLDGLSAKTYPAFELSWIADYPDPDTFVGALFGSTSPDNYSGYRNERLDALLAQAAQTLDPARRSDVYAQAQDLLLASGVVLPLYHEVRYTLVRPELKGVTVTPLGILALDGAWLERP